MPKKKTPETEKILEKLSEEADSNYNLIKELSTSQLEKLTQAEKSPIFRQLLYYHLFDEIRDILPNQSDQYCREKLAKIKSKLEVLFYFQGISFAKENNKSLNQDTTI